MKHQMGFKTCATTNFMFLMTFAGVVENFSNNLRLHIS